MDNIIQHKPVAKSPPSRLRLSIQSRAILSFEELQSIVIQYGHSLINEAHIEIHFLLPLQVPIKPLFLLLKTLQERISSHSICLFAWNITRNKYCTTKVVMK